MANERQKLNPLGYEAGDVIGATGVERSWESYLRGQRGWRGRLRRSGVLSIRIFRILLILLRILRAHGGTVDIQSTPDVGTTVILRFPLKHRRVRTLEAPKS